MNRFTWIVLIAVGIWIGLDSFYVVQEGEQGIITKFGEYRYSFTDPGLKWKSPFADTVHRMQKRILTSDVPPAEYQTLDKNKLVADPVTRWRIVDPITFFKKVRDVSGAKARLDDIVNSELRRKIASHDFSDIIGGERDPLMDSVAQSARQQVKLFGIQLVDVRIKRADLSQEVEESVFQRMRAERDRIAKRYRSEGEEEAAKIRADTDKLKAILLAQAYEKAQELRGEGDAQSITIYANAYNKDPEFYSFTRTLEAYERGIDPKTHLVLSTSNDLLKFMASDD